jgi:phospholipid/cholesterol/gamma-HCH transport system substrate-binding protein
MRRNVIESVMGAVVLLIAIAFVVFAFQSSGLSTPGGYQVTARFNDASGLNTGTDVRIAGVKIGTVSGQALDPETYLANITLDIEREIELPSDSSARILPDGLLGGNFISIEPGAEEELLADGGRIEFTQSAINVVELISRFVFNTDGGGGDQ